MHRGYVICCKTSLPGAGKTRNMYLFFFFFFLQTDLLQNRIDSGMAGQNGRHRHLVRLVAMLQNIYCTFLLPVLPPLFIVTTIVSFYHSFIKQPQASWKKQL